MCFWFVAQRKKEGLDHHSSLACVIGFPFGQAEPWQCQTHQGGDIQYKLHHHFPHEQHNSMGPEMGMHLRPREPPFLWKLPLSCFKHYNWRSVCASMCKCVFNSACVWGWRAVCCVFLLCGRWLAMCVHVNVHTFTAGQLRLCMCVCEVGAAESYHKLVGHSSAANQRRKRLWVSPHQANLWPWY